MPCYHPLDAWRSKRAVSVKTGKPAIFFKEKYVRPFPPADREHLKLPCGRCIGCRLERSRQWAVRCVHEASLYDENCFVTLTYNEKYCPGTLVKRDFQLFMKRLRRFLDGDGGQAKRVRYYMCGEYGENFGRPHFHACLFGYDFPDREFWSEREGVRLFRSKILEKLWTHPGSGESFGFSTVGDVTFESAAYVARYVMKKVTGEQAEAWYGDRLPEYTSMSLKPGIARKWIEGFQDSVYPGDYVVMRGGFKCKPPRYYDDVYELTEPEKSSIIKANRKDRARKSPDNEPSRLAAREAVKKAQLGQLKRSLQ